MKLSSQSRSLIEQTLQEALKTLSVSGEGQLAITDIHIQPKADSGELIVYNDDDEELAHELIEEWAENEEGEEHFNADVETLFRSMLKKWQDDGMLDNLPIMKPYSFVLVDDEKETIAELLLVDDDTLMLNGDLLKGFDKELDDFLKKLLEE